MRAIFEELEGEIARLIPDNGNDPIEINRDRLPEDARLGDVFEVYYQSKEMNSIAKIVLIPNERTKRLENMKSKREALLKRSKRTE